MDPEMRLRTDKHTDTRAQTDRHAHHNTPLPYWELSNEAVVVITMTLTSLSFRPHHIHGVHRRGLLLSTLRGLSVCLSVCLSVSLLDTTVSPAKTAEPIEMPFGM